MTFCHRLFLYAYVIRAPQILKLCAAVWESASPSAFREMQSGHNPNRQRKLLVQDSPPLIFLSRDRALYVWHVDFAASLQGCKYTENAPRCH